MASFFEGRRRKSAPEVTRLVEPEDDTVVADGVVEDDDTGVAEAPVEMPTRMPETPFTCGLVHRSLEGAHAAPWRKTDEHSLLMAVFANVSSVDGVSLGAIAVKSSFVTRKETSLLI